MVEESKPDGKGTDETDPYASVPFFRKIFGGHAVSQDRGRSMRPGPTSLLAGDGRARMTSETCCVSLASAPGNPGDWDGVNVGAVSGSWGTARRDLGQGAR